MAVELGPWPGGVSESTAILWVQTLLEVGRMSLPSSLQVQSSRETREKHEAFVTEHSK